VTAIRIRRPDPARFDAEADAAMAVQRAAIRATLPGLREPHTAAEDAAWIRGIFARHSVWLAVDSERVMGVASRDGEWVLQLYVAPERTGEGIGQSLLDMLLAEAAPLGVLRLWTFQRNAGARRFYERNRFIAVEFGDGSGNEEGEPDVRYERAIPAPA
jgi:GNAT superfamily N-acetyltransferase